MHSLWHWLAELGEVYTRHAARHGPNRLLPVEVLPGHGCVPGHADPSRRPLVPTGVRRSPPRRKSAHGMD
jgi:hypothetical protein